MAMLDFQVVTPEKKVLQQEVASLTCPTTMGQITILPGHVPLIASLKPGELSVKTGSGASAQTEYIAVSGGFVEIRPGNKVIILADTAERDTEIDAELAEQAKNRAEAAMKEKQTLSAEEYALLAASLQKNLARLKVARRKHHSHAQHLPENISE